MIHVSEIIQYLSCCVWQNVFYVHLYCSMYQYLIPFYGWIIFYCTDVTHFVLIHLSTDGQLDCFYFLSIMNNAAVNIHVQVFMWTYVFNSLGYICRSGITGSYGNSMCSILRNCQTVFQSGCTISRSHHVCNRKKKLIQQNYHIDYLILAHCNYRGYRFFFPV